MRRDMLVLVQVIGLEQLNLLYYYNLNKWLLLILSLLLLLYMY